ncbi:MAG: DUF480 domain-containing protein [Desulfuromonas sp.]|nr:MAG: DUF480 domain-containing protein [Desulfuromonas sp.]
MATQLTAVEARVLGCLIEKELATPDYYPLTLNALVNACNQKSNRSPVMALEELDVQDALDTLARKRLAYRSAEGSRALKYCHNVPAVLHLEPVELAMLAELLLRGPQTLGELRGRVERMAPLESLEEAEEKVQGLLEREEPLVVRLPRQPGRKEQRIAQTMTELPAAEDEGAAASVLITGSSERIAALEEEVALLRSQLEELSQRFDRFQAEFE